MDNEMREKYTKRMESTFAKQFEILKDLDAENDKELIHMIARNIIYSNDFAGIIMDSILDSFTNVKYQEKLKSIDDISWKSLDKNCKLNRMLFENQDEFVEVRDFGWGKLNLLLKPEDMFHMDKRSRYE